MEGNTYTELAKFIFKARSKEHKNWRYGYNKFAGCSEQIETESELISCPGFSEH